MRVLIDEQLPAVLARCIRDKGHQAEHVDDCGLSTATDGAIWAYARRVDAVIVTKDEDFARRRALANQGPRIVWIRLPNTRRAALVTWFERALPDLLTGLARNEHLIEVVE